MERYPKLKEKIRTLMYDNLHANYSPYLKTDYCYVMPSPQRYPFQWWWDTCFNIITLCHLEEWELAKRNLSSLFAMQDKNGFVGHMIFWESMLPKDKLNILQGPPKWWRIRPHMSSLIQPPLVAQALRVIFEFTHDRQFLADMLPKLKKYFLWLKSTREFDGDELLTIITPFESGIDWKPSFDEVIHFKPGQATERFFWNIMYVDFRNLMHGYHIEKIRKANYFLVKEVLLNTMYALDLESLSKLCEYAGENGSEYLNRSKRVRDSMLNIMYDDDHAAFFDVYGKNNKKSQVLTFTIPLPLLLDGVPGKIAHEIIERHFLNKDEFALPYAVPSVALSEPSFSTKESKFLWRGPTWILTNWLIQRCFLQYDYHNEADWLCDVTLELIEKSGFREYYDPFTGQGYGAKSFTWGGLILDMLFRKEKAYEKLQTHKT